jgi:hypothetical protein
VVDELWLPLFPLVVLVALGRPSDLHKLAFVVIMGCLLLSPSIGPFPALAVDRVKLVPKALRKHGPTFVGPTMVVFP